MSATSRVSATAASGGPSLTGWVSQADRRGSNGPVDPASPGAFFNVGDYWQRFYGDAANDQGRYYPLKQQEAPYFTPLVGQMAASFLAVDAVSDTRLTPSLFLSDFKRAISRYEFIMKASGDSLDYQGTLVNRYS